MELLRQVERHLRRSGIPPTTFGREALNDPRFVFDLRRGRQVGRMTTARVEAFIRGREAPIRGGKAAKEPSCKA